MYKIRNFFTKLCYGKHPNSATMEEWAAIHKEERKKPFCYWISCTVPTYFSVKMMQLGDFKRWFVYRLNPRHKYHLIDTKLKPAYYENEVRMLHGMFSLLVDFVEHEKAQLHRLSMEKGDVKPSPRFAGLKHLDWEIALTFEEEDYIDKELWGKPTHQAVAAQKIKDLYLWWLDERTARPDPWDDEDWEASKPTRTDDKESVFEMMANRTPEQKEAANKSFRKREAIEEAYDAEDEKMLIRLIKIRNNLWT